MLNTLEMERYIQATARRADLHVKWEPTALPRTDGKTIFLPRLSATTTQEQYDKLRYYVLHEVDHVLYSDFKKVQETHLTPDRSLLGALWNLLEDQRIERLGSKEYVGDKLCANDTRRGLVANTAKMALENKAKEAVQTLLPSIAWANRTEAEFYPSAHLNQAALEAPLLAKGKALYDKLVKGDYSDVLRNASEIADPVKGSAATLKLAERIFKEVYEQDPEKEKERVKKEAEAEGKGQGEQGQGKGKGKQPGEGEGQGEEGDGEGEGDEGEDGKPGKATPKSMKYGEMMVDAHAETRLHSGAKQDYSSYRESRNYRPATKEEFEVRDVRSKMEGGRADSGIKQALASTSVGFANRVRTILQIRDRDKWQYGKKRGRLNGSALHRVLVKDAPHYAERVFKQKQVNDVLDAAVTLLVDQSGSMGGGAGSKFAHAAAAAVMLNDTIGNTLHVPCEILSFTSARVKGGTMGEDIIMYVHRGFEDKLVPRDALVSRMSYAAGQGLLNNCDGESILWAFDRLIQRPEKRKVLVVFSDGSPCGGGRGDIVWYTKHVVKQIETKSPVDIVGIGIMDDNVKHIYKEHHVIDDARELENALLQVVENKLR